MNSTPSAEDRRESSVPLIATLTLICTVFLSSFVWSDVNKPQAEAKPATPAVATATQNAPEIADMDPGCGCAEACLSAH